MTYEQFKNIPDEEKLYMLWNYGVELGNIKRNLYHFKLYQVDGFYMEVKYIQPDTIVQVICFEDLELIEPYLKSINISSLLAA
jgi:hypothetical protein